MIKKTFKNTLVDSLYWWLGKKNHFIINDEYKLELLFIDKINNSAKIKITNLKNKTEETVVDSESVHERR